MTCVKQTNKRQVEERVQDRQEAVDIYPLKELGHVIFRNEYILWNYEKRVALMDIQTNALSNFLEGPWHI
jgi:hypothetical protein